MLLSVLCNLNIVIIKFMFGIWVGVKVYKYCSKSNSKLLMNITYFVNNTSLINLFIVFFAFFFF